MNVPVKSTAGQAPKGADWNPYEILGLTPPASERTIRTAYRRLARSMHPDTGGDESNFLALQEAYDFLLDPVTRSLWEKKSIRATPAQRQKAVAGLKGLCDEVISFVVNGGLPPEHANIPVLMKKELRARLDKLAAAESDTKRQIGRHKLMVNTVTRKGRGENIVAQVLARRFDELAAILGKISDESVIGEIMLAELSAYDSCVPDGQVRMDDFDIGKVYFTGGVMGRAWS